MQANVAPKAASSPAVSVFSVRWCAMLGVQDALAAAAANLYSPGVRRLAGQSELATPSSADVGAFRRNVGRRQCSLASPPPLKPAGRCLRVQLAL